MRVFDFVASLHERVPRLRCQLSIMNMHRSSQLTVVSVICGGTFGEARCSDDDNDDDDDHDDHDDDDHDDHDDDDAGGGGGGGGVW